MQHKVDGGGTTEGPRGDQGCGPCHLAHKFDGGGTTEGPRGDQGCGPCHMEYKFDGGGTTEGPRRDLYRPFPTVDTDAPTKLRHPQALRAKHARRLHAPIDRKNREVVELSAGFGGAAACYLRGCGGIGGQTSEELETPFRWRLRGPGGMASNSRPASLECGVHASVDANS